MIEISLKAEELFHIGSVPITNSLVVTLAVTGFLLAASIIFQRKQQLVPAGFQNFIEAGLEGFLGLAASVLGNREKAERYLPFVATIFLTVIVSNWLGLLPGVGSVGLNEVRGGHEVFVPLFRSPSADLNFTLALAVAAVVGVNLFGVAALGFFRHIGKFFTVKGPIEFFVGILEFISEIAKMISFSFRLFGNIFAGEVLLIIVGVLIPYLIPLPFLLLELFVGFIQAFVFSMLT
ncbi:F0F1 ATP synthase subunit A, partial [Candidatus Uhrbacteria bacterium]|nr:F0F1 ATP synthase subunit A [Candidatus Uhrbacteria bacterium]